MTLAAVGKHASIFSNDTSTNQFETLPGSAAGRPQTHLLLLGAAAAEALGPHQGLEHSELPRRDGLFLHPTQ